MKRSRVLAGLAAGLLTAPAPAVRAQAATLRVGFDPIEANTNFICAMAQGYFARAGVTIDASPTRNGAAGAAAVVSGALDVTHINVASLVTATARGVPLVAVGMGEMYDSKAPTDQLLVVKDSPLTSARDLIGKSVAVNVLNGLGHMATELWLMQNGVDPAGVRYPEMPFSVMPDALLAGRVDVIGVVEPELSEAKRRGARVFVSEYDAIAPEFLIAVSVASSTWAAQNADLVRRYSSALHEASIWANRHRDESAVIDARVMHADVAAIRAITRATFPEDQRPVALLQPVFDAVAKVARVASRSAQAVISPALTT